MHASWRLLISNRVGALATFVPVEIRIESRLLASYAMKFEVPREGELLGRRVAGSE